MLNFKDGKFQVYDGASSKPFLTNINGQWIRFKVVFRGSQKEIDVYYGDYQEMITNYEWIKDRPSRPLYQLIKHAYESGGHAVARTACIALWRSFKKGHAALSDLELSHLVWYYRKTLEALSLPVELE